MGHDDPARISEIAHSTAAALIGAGRESQDPEITRRLVTLVDELGLSTLAELWSERPARSLPGALWRLYVLREWVRRDPDEVSADYSAGIPYAEVSRAIAGVAEPPGPSELRALADQVLTGVFDADLSVALDRAAAFCRVCATGRAYRASDAGLPAPQAALMTRRASNLMATGDDLAASARMWAAGGLD